MSDDKDKRPDVAKDDDHPKPRESAKEHWSNAEDTMNEGPAGSPNAEKQSRTS
ncbi:hypothetical protein OS189_17850 [Sulfitobacter sp. F26169L]|uniref:hypothetical protein n=1 Tax=Sulfitobacter sp. F26169L TaxID=2996015 RepID=UPI002260B4F4|nr:hypothetical protein [Sulfitobacter sp. F26169L]MCX7568209.1 hypothetical protein [Sulfitobacter sp. F26169L]